MTSNRNYDIVRDRLRHAYDSGRLTPFLGSGMSYPACRLWGPLVKQLEIKAGYPEAQTSDQRSPQELVRVANKAMQHLRLTRSSMEIASCLREALFQSSDVPAGTTNLSSVFWPLVLTTNYDDLFWTAFANRHRAQDILGRSPAHCHQVLESLRVPSEPILWALQGFLGQISSCPIPASRVQGLAEEVVVGHQEYRRVAHTEPHFRRAFAEVFRSRSLMFLGFGLQDPYIMELFSEIIELFGPNPLPHYAFAKSSEVDVTFFAQQFNIVVVTYEDHAELPHILHDLATDLRAARPKVRSWSFDMKSGQHLRANNGIGSMTVVAGGLPNPENGECIAVSVGKKGGKFWFGEMISALDHLVSCNTLPTNWMDTANTVEVDSMIYELQGYPVFLVAARDDAGERDLLSVKRATQQLLEAVSGRYRTVRVGILAAGRRRAVPAPFLFTQMVRGYREWHKRSQDHELDVSIHVVASDILFYLRSGRIDVSELLLCEDLRFWLEISDYEGRVERLSLHCPADTPVRALLSSVCNLTCTTWTVDVMPPPRRDWFAKPSVDVRAEDTLESLGVIPGSTLRFDFGREMHKSAFGISPIAPSNSRPHIPAIFER